jgi:hypothetical protein
MVRFLAVIRVDGSGKAIPVVEEELRRTVAHEEAIGSRVVGDYGDPDRAKRAVMLALQGWTRPAERKTAI